MIGHPWLKSWAISNTTNKIKHSLRFQPPGRNEYSSQRSPWLKPRAISKYHTNQNIACGFNRRNAMDVCRNNTLPVVETTGYIKYHTNQNIACGFNRRTRGISVTIIRSPWLKPGYIEIPQTKSNIACGFNRWDATDVRNNNPSPVMACSPWLKPRAILKYDAQKQNIANGFNHWKTIQ